MFVLSLACSTHTLLLFECLCGSHRGIEDVAPLWLTYDDLAEFFAVIYGRGLLDFSLGRNVLHVFIHSNDRLLYLNRLRLFDSDGVFRSS